MPLVPLPGQCRHSVRSKRLDASGNLVVSRHDHPAFAHGDVLVREEAEATDAADRTEWAPFPTGARGVRRVLDDGEAVPLRAIEHRGHVAGEASVMEHDDGLGHRTDRGLEIRRMEVQVVLTHDVAEHRHCADASHGVGCCDEVERRKNDLVARAATDSEQCQVQCSCAVRNGKCVSGLDDLSESVLELGNAGAHAPPTRRDRVSARGEQLVIDLDVRERNAPGDRCAHVAPPGRRSPSGSSLDCGRQEGVEKGVHT